MAATRTPDRTADTSRTVGTVALSGAGTTAGLAVGAVTSFAQGVLSGPFAGLANAVSPWVVAPFLLGSRARTLPRATLVGLLVCLAEVVGYYATAQLRGFGVGSTTFVWLAAAVLAGPVFAVAGLLWAGGPDELRGLGAALLVAVWAAEAVVTYAVVLRYEGTAVLFGATAVLLFGLLGRRDAQHGRVLRWLAAALPLGIAGEVALHALV